MHHQLGEYIFINTNDWKSKGICVDLQKHKSLNLWLERNERTRKQVNKEIKQVGKDVTVNEE